MVKRGAIMGGCDIQGRILKQTLVAVVILTSVLTGQQEAHAAEYVWNVAPGRSSVEFSIKHFLLMEVKGKFRKYSGTVKTKSPMDFEGAQVKASIPISSIYTGNRDRDSHLKNEDFFASSKFPNMEFVSSSVKKTGKGKFRMDGTITIRGVSKKISFDVTHQKDKKLPGGKLCCVFKAVANLDRYDFGLKWNELTEAGGFAVGQKVDIQMNIALVRKL